MRKNPLSFDYNIHARKSQWASVHSRGETARTWRGGGLVIAMLFLMFSFGWWLLGAGATLAEEMPVENEEATRPSATQLAAIKDHCETIRENLRAVQREDSRARVYLGRYYEIILTKFITPLNVRLVENNLSDSALIENQSSFAAVRGEFMNDFVSYQRGLEELTGMDCKAEPAKFYEKLTRVRAKRQVVADEVTKIRDLAAGQVKLVERLRKKL